MIAICVIQNRNFAGPGQLGLQLIIVLVLECMCVYVASQEQAIPTRRKTRAFPTIPNLVLPWDLFRAARVEAKTLRLATGQ